MPRLISGLLLSPRDPRLLKVPPYISLICIVVGVVWLFMLPLDEYSRRTYISENALLPGQVHTYFGGSDQNVFRAYRHEIDELADKANIEVNDKLEQIFKGVGLKTGRQNYTYNSAGSSFHGENIYAILQAPRGDATEAIVLVAAWRNIEGVFNRNGVSLALALTRYFKRWSLWSKDIILLVSPDSRSGIQAWVDAYHDAHDLSKVASLPLKSGALQGALALDYPQEGRFESVHIAYDGVNGQLPNLDLLNSVVNIASGQMGMGSTLQRMWKHKDNYEDRMRTILRGMVNQGLGHATGPHSAFIPFHVDAITLQPIGEGWHDEMGLGRLIEGTFRSLNNLLEHLHQSFFFYLLMQKERFVSIGTYLPSAMLIAVNFTIMAIALWVKSGWREEDLNKPPKSTTTDANQEASADAPAPAVERDFFLPLGIVAATQLLGFIPLFIFTHTPSSLLLPGFISFLALNLALPFLASQFLSGAHALTSQQYQLVQSFSLLLLGMFLSSLATLNFSLAFMTGLLASPLTFVRPSGGKIWLVALQYIVLAVLSPPVVVTLASAYSGVSLQDVLTEATFAWHVDGTYTPLVFWCVWWPAWLAGAVLVLGNPQAKSKAKTA